MTKIDFSDKINRLNISIFDKDGNIKILMEVSADNYIDKVFPQCKHSHTCATIKKMDELNVNLLEAANYLILLFYRTDQEYSCTRTKIGKLLSIVAFSYARENKRLFKEKIYKYDDCGCAITEVMTFFDRDIYARCQYNDNQKYISSIFKDISLLEDTIRDKYDNIFNIDPSIRQRLEEVFRIFGSYSPTELGKCINPIVEQNGVVNINGDVDLCKIYELNRNELQINACEPKVLIDYLFN